MNSELILKTFFGLFCALMGFSMNGLTYIGKNFAQPFKHCAKIGKMGRLKKVITEK